MARTQRDTPLVIGQGHLAEDFCAKLGRARHRIVGKVLGPGRGPSSVPLAKRIAEGPTWAVGTAVLSRLSRRERRELEEIAAAEARLDAGTFGLCERCRAPISTRCLRASPTARRCARCETQRLPRARETSARRCSSGPPARRLAAGVQDAS